MKFTKPTVVSESLSLKLIESGEKEVDGHMKWRSDTLKTESEQSLSLKVVIWYLCNGSTSYMP